MPLLVRKIDQLESAKAFLAASEDERANIMEIVAALRQAVAAVIAALDARAK